MLRAVLLTTLLLPLPRAFAADADAGKFFGELDDAHYVICERMLEKTEVREQEQGIANLILGKPYTVWTMTPVTAKGLEAFGLDPHTSEDDLQKLVLVATRSGRGQNLNVSLFSHSNGQFLVAFELELESPALAGYDDVKLSAKDRNLTYTELIKKYPSGRGFKSGYHTAPDRNGVRHYVLFDPVAPEGDGITSSVEFGIDVPLAKARQFSDAEGEFRDELHTAAGHFRRIPILIFGRSELDTQGLTRR